MDPREPPSPPRPPRSSAPPSPARTGARPLDGIRVVELGQLIAGPFAGSVLAYFGAEVVKVEPPGRGDAIRGWRALRDGTSYFWRTLGRNKKSVTLSLRTEEGRALVKRLIDDADVVVENFRAGAMEGWGLGPEAFEASNPGLVYARVSGYGQTGPYSDRPGYASVCEGIGGFRYLNGFPGEAPVRPNLSLGDTLAGLHAALGVLLALVERGKSSRGQLVDVAIYESVFNVLESVVPEYDGAGLVREPSGTTLTGIVPTNTYPCRDGRYVVIGGNGDAIYRRLMRAAGRADLADDPRLADNAGRVEHERLIDDALAAWTRSLDAGEVLALLKDADVPAGPIYSVADIMEDPHYRARDMFHRVEAGGEPLVLPAMAPRLGATPGGTAWAGPELGAHNREVLEERLGLRPEEIEALRGKGVL